MIHGLTSECHNALDKKTFVVFLHIQKTAGITVQTYLRQRYGPSAAKRVVWRATKDQRLDPNTITAARARTLSDGYFGGHFCFGMHQHLPGPASYMTFLRDPIDRYVSLFHYSQKNPHAYYHKHARDRDLVGFLTEAGLMELDNGMTRFIAGSTDNVFINRTPIGSVDERLLDQAKQNISSSFFFVGIQERFDESFLLLAKLLGDDSPRYLRLNSGAHRSARPTIDNSIATEIRKRSIIDIELYEFARKQFEVAVREHLPDIDERLERFRTENERYNARIAPIHNLVSRLKPRSFQAG